MRNPETILNSLSAHSKDVHYKYERLYRILFNEQMFYVAYQSIYAKPGNMTPGSDGKTIDGMSVDRIGHLIAALKDESYMPTPARRVFIPKKNGKIRPLGIPSIEDKMVQEVVRLIIEAVYEGHFENSSHGFRPRRSCHTALRSIQTLFTGANWFIEGDIKGFFDNIDHHILIETLRERISDERFLRLIWKFLKAGYIEDFTFHKTYSGTPQGGIISPILANIYLDKFDKYMREYAESFDKGKKKRENPLHASYSRKAVRLRKTIRNATDEDTKRELLTQLKEVEAKTRRVPASMAMDSNYKRLKYIRYADDFLIGVIGSKADCAKMKENFTIFMRDKLKLELSEEKTLITNAQDSAKFLGYEISVRKSEAMKRNKLGWLKRPFSGRIILALPIASVQKKLLELKAMELRVINGKEIWYAMPRNYLTKEDPATICARYTTEIRGLYQYYRIADNISFAGSKFGYKMRYSICKTLAKKLNSSTAKVIRKYRRDPALAIPYQAKKGETKFRILYNDGFARQEPDKDATCDNLPNTFVLPFPTLAERLMEHKCELCGATNVKTVMYQVRKLKGINTDTEWHRLMIKKWRKTLAVCKHCNANIHAHDK
mgnify:FL=1